METENLGMAGFEDLAKSLDSIKSQTFPLKKLKEVVLVVGGHLTPKVLQVIQKKYPWVKIHMEKEIFRKDFSDCYFCAHGKSSNYF